MSTLKCNRIENTSTASGGLDVDTSGKVRVTTLADSAGNNDSTPAEIASGRAKAWVNFNGTGTVAIRGSYNVSSITDNGTGDYTVNITNALPSANYAVTTSYFSSASSTNTCRVRNNSMTTTAFDIETGSFQSGSTNVDIDYECIMCSAFI